MKRFLYLIMFGLMVLLFEEYPNLRIIGLVLALTFLLMPPSEEVKERQMKSWGVSGIKVWWKLMTFQKNLDPEKQVSNTTRIVIGLAVIGLAIGSLYVIGEFLYYTLATGFPPDLPKAE